MTIRGTVEWRSRRCLRSSPSLAHSPCPKPQVTFERVLLADTTAAMKKVLEYLNLPRDPETMYQRAQTEPPREPPVDLEAICVYGKLEFARRTACLLGILQMHFREQLPATRLPAGLIDAPPYCSISCPRPILSGNGANSTSLANGTYRTLHSETEGWCIIYSYL